MISLLLVIVLLILVINHYLVHYGKAGKFINLIPGPKALPLVGNLWNFKLPPEQLWVVVREMNTRLYPINRLWSFSVPSINVRHPNDLELLLGTTKYNQKSRLYQLLHPWFNTGLLTSAGAKWQKRRKILTPAFHFNVLQQFVDIFIEEGERMRDSLKNDGKPVVQDLLPLVSEHTLNAICETAMGTSLQGKGAFQNNYRRAVYEMGKVLVYRLVRPYFFYTPIFYFSPKYWRQSKLLGILHGFTKKIINERKDYHEKTGGRYLTGFDREASEDPQRSEFDVGIKKRRLAMLDLLIAASKNKEIDDEGIREEVDTFMFEGHDTTAMAICFSLMLLAEHKDIQDRARAEVDEVLQENGGKMSMSVLQRLPYLERCIKESLRIYPSVHFISREVETDVQLSDYMVPAGTMVHIHIIDAHRDPNFWPNPMVFDPDRFLPERIQGRHPYSYVPFSAGPRNCIGQRFAMLELKTVIGLMLHNFHLEPVDYLKDLCVTADLVIRPAHPIRLRFIPVA